MTRVVCAVALLVAAGCKSPRSSVDAGPSRDWLEGVFVDAPTSPVHDGGTLVIRAMSEPNGLNTLDDGFRDAWTTRITQRLVVESLLEIDPTTYELLPALASKWTDSVDHLTTTLELRRGVRFHDGAPFTSADVTATFDSVFSAAHATGSIRGELAGLSAWKALDEHTVQLTWSTPSPFAFRALAKLPMLRAAQLQADWSALATAPVGTGPFKLERWERGSSLTLTRSNTWWGGNVPLDEVRFRFVKDHTIAASLAEKGEFDVMTNVPAAMWRSIEGANGAWAQREYQRLRATDNSFSYIAWNETNAALRDVQVRRALAALYPSQLVTRIVDLNLETPTNCPYPVSLGKCVSDAGLPSADEAVATLADARIGTLSVLVPSTAVRLTKLVPLYAEQLERAGVDLRTEPVDIATMTARVRGRSYVAASRVWTEFDAEQDLFPLFHSSQIDGGSNFAGYSNGEADALLTAIRAEWNPRKRMELERQLHRLLVATQPFLIMSARQSLDLAKRRVHGLRPSFVWYDLRRVWVDH